MKRRRLRVKKVQLVGSSNSDRAKTLVACHKAGISAKEKQISEGILSSRWINRGV
jgi:hypothetical protein